MDGIIYYSVIFLFFEMYFKVNETILINNQFSTKIRIFGYLCTIFWPLDLLLDA